MQVTLGGDRLGSGNKNKIALRNYERSTHNLTQKFTSSLQVGTLYPFLVIPAMRGDKFEINLEADARTIPTKGPLFGSFKMQMDVFECPVRLYQAILHNNPLKIGLNMSQVKFPVLEIKDEKGNAFANNALLKYLGMSGIGHPINNDYPAISRKINAIPALTYYEIFKTYYSNKQEDNAYIIGTETISGNLNEFTFEIEDNIYNVDDEITTPLGFLPFIVNINFNGQPNKGWENNLQIEFTDENENLVGAINFGNTTLYDMGVIEKISNSRYFIKSIPYYPAFKDTEIAKFSIITVINNIYTTKQRGLEAFPLSNIDDMRLKLLSHHTLGSAFTIRNTENDYEGEWDAASGGDHSGMPYLKLVDEYQDGQGNHITKNAEPLNGLVVKTYQSDIYNNWINTEWIDGENGIAAITAISTASGSVKMDTINLAEKLYNMLNRVATSDGTYDGWQDAVYTDTPKRHIESPIYLGGMSSEVMFEEIVQTSQSTPESPLGNLGGKGKLFKNKGGHVTVKCSEACFIIGIVSLTPRINYCQGNEFYMTDLFSMDDFHKPALDGIGFQNLIAERMAWWDTTITANGVAHRHTIGKLPAWIEYMTAVDKCYGDFAETEGRGFMTLLRDYTRSANNTIQDATTYVDPRKYNYAFAYTDIDAQNFWVQIKSDIKARRLMSAKQIPNL